jgi:hypothetical protein
MTTTFVVCFIAGLGLSVLSFASGMHHAPLVTGLFHGHRALHVPKGLRAGTHRTPAVNPTAMAAFLVWFGGSGLLLTRVSQLSEPVVFVAGCVAGLGAGSLLNAAIGALARRESPAVTLSMTGVIGRITVPVREGGGTGEIVFTHDGTRRVAAARSERGFALPKGAEVVVMRYEKGIAYVVTWDDLSSMAVGGQESGLRESSPVARDPDR